MVFGGKSSKQRNRHMIKLLNKGFRVLAEQGTTLVDGGTSVPQVPVKPVTTETAAVTSGKRADGWGIQVGAFADRAHAKRVATDAASLVPELLENGHVTVVPLIQQSGKQLYRSRIHGITKKQAYHGVQDAGAAQAPVHGASCTGFARSGRRQSVGSPTLPSVVEVRHHPAFRPREVRAFEASAPFLKRPGAVR